MVNSVFRAVGTTAPSRLAMMVQCAAHMRHRIGQMIYLGYEWRRQAGTSPK